MSANLWLFRGMWMADTGLPLVGPTSRTLGARPGIDIPVQDGVVRPGSGGMSVAPRDPWNLPPHRRPPAHGGMGKDPVWRIDVNSLGPNLAYRPDPANPDGHGFVEPASAMLFDDYQRALAETAAAWERLDEQRPAPRPVGW